MRKSLLIFLVAIFATSIAFADNIDKLSAGTQMFLSERRGEIKLPRLKDKMTVADLQQAAGDSLILFKDEQLMKKRVDRKIAEAEMVNGVEMISAFVKVKSGGFSAIEAMGAVMQTKFNDNLAAMMLPADKIEKIADLDNVIGIEVHQHIVVIAVMKHLAGILHIQLDTVDEYQGLGIGRQRIDTANQHQIAQAGDAAVRHGTHVGAQLLLHQRVDTDGRGVGKVGSLGSQRSGGHRRIGG